ncbi:MAG: type II secretion system major pseudopilin GspG [Thermoguttaceae bacterium]|jgi:general secretion pathway protein G
MKSHRPRRRRGFTLIEVLMVLIILVIIASLAVGTYTAQRNAAMVNAAKSQIGLFKSPLDLYNLDMYAYPTNNQGLAALCNPPSDASATEWNGPYMETIPLDPWKREYRYISPGRNNPISYDLWSVGPDGVDGTADDIGNWSLGR